MKFILAALLFITGHELKAQEDTLDSRVYRLDAAKAVKTNGNERRQVVIGSTTDLQELEIHTLKLAAGSAPHAAHVHSDFDELVIVKEGVLQVTIKDSTKQIGTGSVAFAIAGDEHGLKNISGKPVTYYILKFKPFARHTQTGNSFPGSFMKDWKDFEVKQTDKGQSRPIFDITTPMFAKFDLVCRRQ